MKILHLAILSLFRSPIKSILLCLSIVTAFVLLGYLLSINAAFNSGIQVAGDDRIVVIHKRSLIKNLPERYFNDIETIYGIKKLSRMGWLGAYYKDTINAFPQYAVEKAYLDMYPELLIPEEEKNNWLLDKSGAILGRTIADKYNWKVGDRITLTSGIWQVENSNFDWEFNVVGIADANKKGWDLNAMLLHYDYFEDKRAYGKGGVGWFMVQIENPDEMDMIIEYINDRFANSSSEVRSASEKSWAVGVNNQAGNYNLIIFMTSGVIMLILSMMVGATIAESVRERSGEYAVLFALGFKNYYLSALLIAEFFMLMVISAVTGLVLAYILVELYGDPTGYFHQMYFPVSKIPYLMVIVILLGILSLTWPIIRLVTMNKIHALRDV